MAPTLAHIGEKRTVPVQFRDGVVAKFELRTLTAGDLAEVAESFGEVASWITGLAYRGHTDRQMAHVTITCGFAALSHYIKLFRRVAKCVDGPDGASIDTLEWHGLGALIDAFNELHFFGDGRKAALEAATKPMTANLMRLLSELKPTSTSSGDSSMSSSAPATNSTAPSPSPSPTSQRSPDSPGPDVAASAPST